ncbi:AI-2E family transporter [Haloechinothrix sp. LS1_15]|uniref:AI-2E family transporter n=1 Tax=Haloechinothrix sp. LS1_15 TaxID=2652248 RepID=UPI002946D84A|nr:AI-2E family transporter [Haloechinothrix sp. LS1_15]
MEETDQPEAAAGSGTEPPVTELIPKGFRVAAAFSWRFLVVAAAAAVLIWLIRELSIVAITLSIALLLAALMMPAVTMLQRARLPRALASVIVLVGGLGILSGVVTFVVAQFADALPEMQQHINRSLDQVRDWLITGPLALEADDLQGFIDQAISFVQEHQQAITTQALTTAGVVGQIVTGFVLVLVILLFFLLHGDRIWTFLTRAVPTYARARVRLAGQRGFETLSRFMRATVIVAIVDAVGIGIGLAIVGVPMVLPLATLVFLGAFIPIVGAVVTGAVAVLVALVTVGWVQALIVLGIVIAVQQLESNVLHPLLMGRAVSLHPLAVLLAVTAGVFIAGIIGALLAVPLLAVVSAAVKSLAQEEPEEPHLPKFARKLAPQRLLRHHEGDDRAEGTESSKRGEGGDAQDTTQAEPGTRA